MNIKRKKFVKNLVDGLGIGESAIRAGYSDTTTGSHLLNEPAVLTALQTAMVKAGIDDKYLSTKIKEGLEASYPEKRTKDGSVLQDKSPDFFTRQMYLDKAFKVRGDYAPEKHIEQKQVLTINVNMDMARGLLDCGAITVEEIKRLDGENDAGPERTQLAQGLLPPGGETGGEEGCGQSEGVRQEAKPIDGMYVEGKVPEDAQRGEGPREAPTD